MSKTFFFFGNVGPHDHGQCRTTRGKDYVVHGGSKEDHEQMVELTHEVSKVSATERPETKGEMNLIIRDSMKKLGMKPANSIRYDEKRNG